MLCIFFYLSLYAFRVLDSSPPFPFGLPNEKQRKSKQARKARTKLYIYLHRLSHSPPSQGFILHKTTHDTWGSGNPRSGIEFRIEKKRIPFRVEVNRK